MAKINVQLKSTSLSSFNLSFLLKEFLLNMPLARRCLEDKDTAETNHRTVSKALYRFLKARDFDPILIEGAGFKSMPTNTSGDIAHRIKEDGVAYVCNNLTHGAVRVNGVVIDLCHKRLGDTYEPSHNFMFKIFSGHWKEVRNVSNMGDLSRADIENISKQNRRQNAFVEFKD